MRKEKKFFSTREVAKYCCVTNDGVLKWIKLGRLQAFSTPGGFYRITAEVFRAFVAQYQIPIPSEAFFEEALYTILLANLTDRNHQVVSAALADLNYPLIIREAYEPYPAAIVIGRIQPDLIIVSSENPDIEWLALAQTMQRMYECREIAWLYVGSPHHTHRIRGIMHIGERTHFKLRTQIRSLLDKARKSTTARLRS